MLHGQLTAQIGMIDYLQMKFDEALPKLEAANGRDWSAGIALASLESGATIAGAGTAAVVAGAGAASPTGVGGAGALLRVLAALACIGAALWLGVPPEPSADDPYGGGYQ